MVMDGLGRVRTFVLVHSRLVHITYLRLHGERRGGEQGRQPPLLLAAGRLGGLLFVVVVRSFVCLGGRKRNVPSASRYARTSKAMRVGLGPAAFPPPAAAVKGRGGAPAAAAHWCSTSSRGTAVWDESLCGMSQTLSGCVHSKAKTDETDKTNNARTYRCPPRRAAGGGRGCRRAGECRGRSRRGRQRHSRRCCSGSGRGTPCRTHCYHRCRCRAKGGRRPFVLCGCVAVCVGRERCLGFGAWGLADPRRRGRECQGLLRAPSSSETPARPSALLPPPNVCGLLRRACFERTQTQITTTPLLARDSIKGSALGESQRRPSLDVCDSDDMDQPNRGAACFPDSTHIDRITIDTCVSTCIAHTFDRRPAAVDRFDHRSSRIKSSRRQSESSLQRLSFLSPRPALRPKPNWKANKGPL